MDSRKLQGGWSVLGVVLVVLGSLPARAETTLWLVRPLYPGQETLVARTEAALDKLMPGEARKGSIIGAKELAGALKSRRVDELPCFGADDRCADPIDPFFANLGFERIVLIEGGQDEAGFKYKVSAFEPKTGRVTPASATAPGLEKALLGAVAKVVPAASTLDVTSTPPGASVYIDDVKMGVTPLSTQVLPGERVVRLDLKLHQPIEDSVVIPIRGAASLDRTLEKVAARIIITATPPGTDISIDGQVLGKDKVDRGILPGTHTIRLSADLYKRYEQQITVKADEQYVLDKALEPSAALLASTVPDTPGAARVGPPPTETELNYGRHSYAQVSFEFARFIGSGLVGSRFGKSGTGRTEEILSPLGSRGMIGVAVEYGTFGSGTVGKYFGLAAFGLSYLTNVDLWKMSVGFAKGANVDPKDSTRILPDCVGSTASDGCFPNPEQIGGSILPRTIDEVRVHLLTIRGLQPQFRVAVWRLMFSIQAGFEFRLGNILETGSVINYRDVEGGPFTGFFAADLMVSGRFNLRYYLVDGLYLTAQANYTQFLLSILGTTTNNGVQAPSSWGLNVGVGYGF